MVSDPRQLPRWWPGVARVEEATPAAWTKVLSARSGRAVRADFTRTAAERPRRIAWRQELLGSPFERILSEARTEIRLEPDGDASTRVELELVETPRGINRFGGFLFRAAARRRAGEALAGLAALVEGRD